MLQLTKFTLCMIFCVVFIKTHAQTPSENHVKYKYFRNRLVNDFMLISDSNGPSLPGESLPATSRYIWSTNTMKWGDVPVTLGWYISVLATEYYYYKNTGQSLEQTKKELFLALEAFNRLDVSAETYLDPPQVGSLNGFFVRDDIANNFISSNSAHFNSHQYSQLDVSIVDSDFQDHQDHNSPLNFVSHDQIWALMMGMALVRQFVDDGVTYNGRTFIDGGNSDIRQEAKNITHRILTWLNKDGDWALKYPGTNECVRGITCSCLGAGVHPDPSCDKPGSYDPNNCEWDVNCGTGAWMLSYGLAVAGHKITGNNYQDAKSLSFKNLWEIYQYGDFPNGPINQIENLSAEILNLNLNIYQPNYDKAIVSKNAEMNKVLPLAAIGDSWFLTTINPGPSPLKLIGIAIGAAAPLPNTVVTTFPDNTTSERLGVISNAENKQIHPLLHQAMYGGANLISKSFYESLLNSAPSHGPCYQVPGCQLEYEWSSMQRWNFAENVGGNFDDRAEYNGLDYMLLHNLYYIVTELYDLNCSIDIEQPNKVINLITSGNKEYHAKNSVTTKDGNSVVVESNEEVWWTAGSYIELNPGFETQVGATFIAEISDCGSLFAREANSDTSNTSTTQTYTKGSTPNPNSEIASTSKLPKQITLIPNPNSGIFEVQLPLKEGETSSTSISIYNPLGELIHKQQTSNSKSLINISNQPRGVYFVRIQQGEEVVVKKVVYQ